MSENPQPNSPIFPVQFPAQPEEVFKRKIALPLRTTIPTHTPPYDGVQEIYYDGADYWLYVYANSAWRTQKLGLSGGTPVGSDTQVQFNDGGVFGANANLLFDKTNSPPTLHLRGIGNIGANDIIIDADATEAHLGNDIIVTAARGVNGGGNGGDINMSAGDANASGGGTGTGGDIFATCGDGRGARGGQFEVNAGDAASGNAEGGGIFHTAGDGNGTGKGGDVQSVGGAGGATGNGGDVYLQGGVGGASSGRGGQVQIDGGDASAGNSNGGDVLISAGTKSGSGVNGEVKISSGSGLYLKSGVDTVTYAATISLDVTLNTFHKTTTVHATGDATINASAAGNAGQLLIILIANDATSDKVITFGTNFLSTGTLTGTASKSAVVTFVSDGSSWYEMSRTTGL